MTRLYLVPLLNRRMLGEICDWMASAKQRLMPRFSGL